MFNLKVRCMTTGNLMKKKIYLGLFCLLASKTLNMITSRIEPCDKYFKNGKFGKLQENNIVFSLRCHQQQS